MNLTFNIVLYDLIIYVHHGHFLPKADIRAQSTGQRKDIAVCYWKLLIAIVFGFRGRTNKAR